MLYYFLLVFPVAILTWVIVTNENIFKYVVGDGAFIYAIVFTIIYIMYVVSMRKLVKVIYYER